MRLTFEHRNSVNDVESLLDLVISSLKISGKGGGVCYYSHHGHENAGTDASPGTFPHSYSVLEQEAEPWC